MVPARRKELDTYARTEIRDWVPSVTRLVDVSTKALVSKSGFSAWIRAPQLRPSSSNRATIAGREVTPSFMKIRRKCADTVQQLIFRTPAITLVGCPSATIRTISCSLGLSGAWSGVVDA